MKKTGKKQLDALHNRHDTPARTWGDVYQRTLKTHTHIPLSEAADFINQFRGVSLDAFKLARELSDACETLYELATNAEASDSDVRDQVIELLKPLVVEDDGKK